MSQPGLRVRRLPHSFVRFEERPVLDVASLLQGDIEVEHENRATAFNPAVGREQTLSTAEITLLATLAESEWTLIETLVADDPERQAALESLVAKQLVLTDADDDATHNLRRQADRLTDTGWFSAAAHFHYAGKWNDTHQRRELADLEPSGEQHVRGYDELYRSLNENFGPPPPTFYQPPAAGASMPLPSGNSNGNSDSPLRRVLQRRKTTRGFDRRQPLAHETLSTILRTTYGCQGIAELTATLSVQRKTSPSAGGLHPVEVYPLVLRVVGLAPGCYHYDVEHHGLAPISTMTVAAAEDLVETLTAGQSYYRSAHVLFIMVARFYRTFWKYRGNSKAYKVLLMDAAHLSQTLYLVCTELGLGAFFTGAVSDVKIEEALALDPIEHGVMGISGCGTVADDQPDGALRTTPFHPAR